MRAERGGEAGFTLVEVMVAVLVVTIGLLGLLVTLNSSGHLDTTVKRQQAVTTRAEQEMEQLRAMGWTQLWMASVPVAGSDPPGSTSDVPTNPNYWVNGSALKIRTNFSSKLQSAPLPGTPAGGETFVVSGSGSTGSGVAPGPTLFAIGGVQGNVWRYVTRVAETCPSGSAVTPAIRLTVAVRLDAVAGLGANKPVWLSTLVANPSGPTCP